MYDNYMGVIEALGFNFAPAGWGYCAGALVSINQQTALFSLLGCRFGGDCRDVFGYPDLRGRVPIGQFQGPGLPDWIMGQRPGLEWKYLSLGNLPTHAHDHSYEGAGGGGALGVKVEVAPVVGTIQEPDTGDYIGMRSNAFGSAAQGNTYVDGGSVTKTAEIGGVFAVGSGGFNNNALALLDTGGSDPISVVAPSQVINYCICIDGYYPSRS